MKKIIILSIFSLAIGLTACDTDRNKAELGGSRDTSNVNRGGGPPISDTGSISAARKDSAKNKQARGNADPSGSFKKSNPPKQQ